MTVRHISSNQSTQEVLTGDNDTWIVDAGVTMSVADEPAFFGRPSFTGNTIKVQGTIESTGTAAYAIRTLGSHTKVNVGTVGTIDAVSSAISLLGAQSQVSNNGTIEADAFGVRIEAGKSLVQNDGTITINGDGTGIFIEGSGGEIENTGTITAAVTGSIGVSLRTANGEKSSLFNSGTIEGAENSIVGGNGSEKVINHGTLNGDVALSGGNDSFNAIGGTLIGDVFGGEGNDTYILGGTNLAPIEGKDEGTDKVLSSVTYTLGANLERLTLSGNAAVDGTGNSSANVLIGNNAANELDGADGRDKLAGRGGADILTGGTGADTFIFANSMGKDVITDFVATGANHDKVDLGAVSAITNFHDLEANHMTQVGADVVIKINSQNKITIEGVNIHDLSSADFLF